MIDKHKDVFKIIFNSLRFVDVLYGRPRACIQGSALRQKNRTAKVQPFEFMEACKHFPKFAAEDKAIAYGIVGGTPQYLLQLDDGLSIKENIKKIFFKSVFIPF